MLPRQHVDVRFQSASVVRIAEEESAEDVKPVSCKWITSASIPLKGNAKKASRRLGNEVDPPQHSAFSNDMKIFFCHCNRKQQCDECPKKFRGQDERRRQDFHGVVPHKPPASLAQDRLTIMFSCKRYMFSLKRYKERKSSNIEG